MIWNIEKVVYFKGIFFVYEDNVVVMEGYEVFWFVVGGKGDGFYIF